MSMKFRASLSGLLCTAALCATLSAPLVVLAQAQEAPVDIESLAAASEPPAFETPEAAIEAFKVTLQADDVDALAGLLGLDAAKLKADENALTTFSQLREAVPRQLLVQGTGDRKILEIGLKLWPMPFPLVKGQDGKWAFDTYAGLEEIVNRRVGENEIEAIATVRAFVDAQQEYAAADRDADGVEEYAQKLVSTEGTTDGLYWPSDAVNGESPAGDAISQAELSDASAGKGYFGYRFRILTGQGENIAGGSYDYVINGNMIAGFALVAWPAKYAETGVNTFAVNQHGIVYETDLGPATEAIVKHIDRFNPDDAWTIVAD